MGVHQRSGDDRALAQRQVVRADGTGGDVFVKTELEVAKRKRDNRTVGRTGRLNAQEVRVVAE